jgi:glycosyltransferase involved in cell wall biosynthesis
MNKKNVVYVFISGRKDKLLEESSDYAKEFFYGYQYFKKIGHNLSIIEFDKKVSIFNAIYFLLNKISDLPFYGQNLINRKNFKILRNTDDIVLTNQKTAFSILPMLLLVKTRKSLNSHVFIMGLFGKQMKYKIKYFFREIFIRILILSSKNLIFLGYGEYEYAINKYSKYRKKFKFLPFAIDTEFWKYSQKKISTKDILFIGNDGMRDYDFLEKLILNMPDHNFKVVSSKFESNIELNNLELYKGDWGTSKFSDDFIRNLYKKSILTILPIRNTYQPSGQSVALQSISVGTPVMITKTEGFWDKSNFINKENIYFIEKNDIELWKNNIENYLQNPIKAEKVQLNGRKLIEKKYNLESFFSELENIIFSS